MRISTVIQSIAFSVLTLNAHAEDAPASAKKALAEMFPATQIRSTAIGDLDRDGIKDVVAVIASTSTDKGMQRIVVLKGGQQARYHVWIQSDTFAEFRKGGPDLEVKRGSLFVHSMETTCCTAGFQNLQFKYNGRQLRLIGVHSGENSTTEEDDFERDVSFNVITGDKVETMRVGKRVKQLKTRLQTKKPQALDGFSMVLAPWIDDAIQFGIDDASDIKDAAYAAQK